jgi:hypothetical protein
MRKIVPFVAAAALISGVASFAVLSSGTAGAGAPKPPVTVTCNSGSANGAGSQLGTETNQLLVGCVGSSTKAKVSPTATITPDVATSSATINWTDKKTTTESFTYAAGGTCPSYLGLAATTSVVVTATVTGGNAGLTVGQSFQSVNCLYSAGGDLLVRSAGSVQA